MPSLDVTIERWPLKAPFRITGKVFEGVDIVTVTIGDGGVEGRGEASGVYYRADDAPVMAARIESLRPLIEAGIDRATLQALVQPCGARNALDCALWDLEAATAGVPVWSLAGLAAPKALTTTCTLSADAPEAVGAGAGAYDSARALKLKLNGDGLDGERVRRAREARPDVWMAVDANQGLTPEGLKALIPTLVEARVALVEQPFPVGTEPLLSELNCPIPVVADESVQGLADIAGLEGRFDGVNIKLDKCGGLTEGLAMAHAARRRGMTVMVGNMIGTSLGMAPAFLVGQACDVVDLDGPLYLTGDRPRAATYSDGLIWCSEAIWGGAR